MKAKITMLGEIHGRIDQIKKELERGGYQSIEVADALFDELVDGVLRGIASRAFWDSSRAALLVMEAADLIDQRRAL